jgi:PAS domain S-box-containing protein
MILKRLVCGDMPRACHQALGLPGLQEREITKELLSTRTHYELILSNMSEGLVEVASNGRIVYANPAVTALAGIPEPKLLGSPFVSLFTGLDRDALSDCLAGDIAAARVVGPLTLGSRRVALTVVSLSGEARSWVGILEDVTEQHNAQQELQRAYEELELRVRDRTAELSALNERLVAEIAERRRAEERISAALTEKELLLREVHHRVKNNLQTISSLVKLPLRGSQDKSVAELVQQTQNRIRSIYLIHEKLYRSQNLAVVDFSEYVSTLAQHLFDSYSVDRDRIRLRVECDSVRLDVDRAIPCGLILNELVSNSLRHAFPDGRRGLVLVKLQHITRRRCRIVVSDNGVGLGAADIGASPRTLGMRLVASLAKQIDATVEVSSAGGTTFSAIFPTTAPRSRAASSGGKP